MSSSVRRVFRAAEAEEEVFVVGESARVQISADERVLTASALMDAARRQAAAILAEAEAHAAAIRGDANQEVESARAEGYAAGLAAGAEESERAAAAYLAVLQAASSEGLAIREAMIDESLPAMARAIAMACRRIVGGAFEEDPALTASVCRDAIQSAAGQQIVSIRVNPAAYDGVRTELIDVAEYVRPDEGVELGGCIVDLRNGRIDASLDTRLNLMELALKNTGGVSE